MNDIKELLNLKHTLKCHEDGKFRILMMSDVQEYSEFNPKTLKAMETMLDVTKPDLVVFGGDNCHGPQINSMEELKQFLDIFASPMEARKIPWAHVFGNHDHDAAEKLGGIEQQLMYEAYPMCVSKHQAECHEPVTKNNVTNFVLPILSNDGKDVVFNVWGLDNGGVYGDLNIYDEQETFVWAVMGFEQLRFYWDSSVALEEYAGHKVPGLMCMHVGLHEYEHVLAEPEKYHLNGYREESIWHQTFNSGIFQMMLLRGDIKAVCAGHSHKNDFESDFCGMKFCFDGCIGYTCYGEDSTRGGRIFDIDANDPSNITTKMIHMKDIDGWDKEFQ